MDSTATTWLAVIAVAAVAQAAVIVGITIIAYRAYAQLGSRITRIERELLEPLSRRLNVVADDVQDIVGRVRTADDEVRRVVQRGAQMAAVATTVAKARLWPALAVSNAVTAAGSWLFRRRDATDAERRTRLAVSTHSLKGLPHVRD